MATKIRPDAHAPSTSSSQDDQPAAVFVLGMHRSGTSALTRVLNLLGVELGDDLLPAAAGNNETGFWEHQAVVDLHDELLTELGSAWDDPRALPEDWFETPAAETVRSRLAERLKADFAKRALWGVKDPRMCRLAPMWSALAEDLGASPAWVIMLRHPMEIVRSLHQRDGMSTGRAYLLWLRHTLEAERATRGRRRAFVDYAALMSDWRPVMKRLADELGLPLKLRGHKAQEEIDGFLKPQLRHFSFHDSALADDPRLAHWVGTAYGALGWLAAGGDDEAEKALDEVAGELAVAGWYYDDAVADAVPREKRLAEEIDGLHHRLHEREIWAAEQDSRVSERDNRIAERDTRIAERDARLAEREATIAAREQVIAELRQAHADAAAGLKEEIREKEVELLLLHSELARLGHHFRYISESWSWRLTLPVRVLSRIGSGILGTLRLRTRPLIPLSFVNVKPLGKERFRAQTLHPHVILGTLRGALPNGWVELQYQIDAERTAIPYLFVDTGAGFNEEGRIRLPPTRNGRGRTVLRLPPRVMGLRFDPVNFLGDFHLGPIRVRELNTVSLAARVIWARLKPAMTDASVRRALWKGLRGAIRRGGLRELRDAFRNDAIAPIPPYQHWWDRHAALTATDVESIQRHIQAMPTRPRLSVVMPTYKTPPAVLDQAIRSVRDQLYPDWELCIADDASGDDATLAVLRRHASEDDRIKVVYRERNGHISEASNSALELATGEFVVLLDHDDELTPHALYLIACELLEHPDADLIYSDEDKLGADGDRYHPYFKPDWSPDMFLAQNYLNHVTAYRRSLVLEVGSFRKGFEGSQDYDLALRVIERTTPERIRHIPFILYHWRAVAGSIADQEEAKDYALEAARRAIREHLDRVGIDATVEAGSDLYSHRVVYALPKDPPLVSLIIPTRNKHDILKLCVDGVREKNDYPNWEIVLVDNGSDEEESLAYFRELEQDPRITVLRDDGPFNYSRLNNRAAAMCKGEIIGLLNNDIEPINPDWLSEMVRQVLQPGVGAVGAKLYYPDETLQHGGVIVGLGGVAGHFDKRLPRENRGYFGRAVIVQNFSAVTAACLLTPRKVWEEVGGLDEERLTVAFNDVDLCLRIGKAGYRIVWTPYAELYHYESLSRGLDTDPEKVERFASEVATMQERWMDVIEADPCYNPNLTVDYERPLLAEPPRVLRPWERFHTA